MRPALISYFDLGVSYGLGDSVFDTADSAAHADLGLVGFSSPLGDGVVADVNDSYPDVIAAWVEGARRQAHREAMEVWPEGLGTPDPDFRDQLAAVIETHPVTACRLTVYAVGTVLVFLELDRDLDLRYLRGVLRCFEYAAYTPTIAKALHGTAVDRASRALPRMATPLTSLTARSLPALESDGSYEEIMLIPSFTTLLLCTEPGDDAALPASMRAVDPSADASKREVVNFEFHGRIHCGWAASAIEAKDLAGPASGHSDPPRDQVARMLACVAIAHVFLGTCSAFERLFLGEIDEQVGGYLRRREGGREPEELNRLRNLALAVVSLTSFGLVTQTDEDRAYYRFFEAASEIDSKSS